MEGKGDYLILSLGLTLDGRFGDYAVIPTRGADHFEELVGVLLGWGVNFVLCSDDDPPGRKAISEFVDNWGLSPSRAFTLAAIDESLKGKKIEAFLEDADLEIIKRHYGTEAAPTKSQIQLFFSEKLALEERVLLSPKFMSRIRAFDDKVRTALDIPRPNPPKSRVRRRTNPTTR